jgi:hypothetical protein
MYSLHVRADQSVKAKTKQTLTKGEYRQHAAFMTDDGKIACIKRDTTVVIADVKFQGASQWMIDKYAGKPMTAVFGVGGSGRYAADCIKTEDGVVFPFHLLADGVTAMIPRKVRKDAGTRKPRDLNKVLGLDQIRAEGGDPNPKPDDNAPSSEPPAEPTPVPVEAPAEPETVA